MHHEAQIYLLKLFPRASKECEQDEFFFCFLLRFYFCFLLWQTWHFFTISAFIPGHNITSILPNKIMTNQNILLVFSFCMLKLFRVKL